MDGGARMRVRGREGGRGIQWWVVVLSLPPPLPHLHFIIEVVFLHVIRALPELLLLAVAVKRDGTAHLLREGGREGGKEG